MKVNLHYSKPLYHPFPLVSYAIRFFDRWDCSHVFLEFPDRGQCFHVYFNEWKMETTYEMMKKHRVVRSQSFNLSDENYNQLLKGCMIDNGIKTKGYYAFLIGAFIGKTFNIANPAIFNDYWTATTCSESLYTRLVYKVKSSSRLSDALLKPLAFKKVSNLTPKDLHTFFKPVEDVIETRKY